MAELEIDFESNLGQALAQFAESGGHLDEALEPVGELLLAAISDVFEAQGPGWAPLAPSTVAARRNKKKSTIKILRDTGAMAQLLDPRYGATYVEAVLGASYAIFHVYGTRYMPKRDPTDLGPYEAGLLDDVADLLVAVLAG